MHRQPLPATADSNPSALQQESVLIEWARTTIPNLVYPNLPGDEMETADHHQFKAEAMAADQACSRQSGDNKECRIIHCTTSLSTT